MPTTKTIEWRHKGQSSTRPRRRIRLIKGIPIDPPIFLSDAIDLWLGDSPEEANDKTYLAIESFSGPLKLPEKRPGVNDALIKVDVPEDTEIWFAEFDPDDPSKHVGTDPAVHLDDTWQSADMNLEIRLDVSA